LQGSVIWFTQMDISNRFQNDIMKITTKEYIDEQIAWVRSLKQMENAWMEKYLETEWRAEREARQLFNTEWAAREKQNAEWRDRIEQMTSQAITRREMRASMVTVITIMLTFLGLLVAIFLKK
jgi:hypothetical protein